MSALEFRVIVKYLIPLLVYGHPLAKVIQDLLAKDEVCSSTAEQPGWLSKA